MTVSFWRVENCRRRSEAHGGVPSEQHKNGFLYSTFPIILRHAAGRGLSVIRKYCFSDIKRASRTMAGSKMQTTIVGALVAALAAYSVMEHQARVRLRAQNEALQRQMADLQKANEQ